jgi:hypothetical protein
MVQPEHKQSYIGHLSDSLSKVVARRLLSLGDWLGGNKGVYSSALSGSKLRRRCMFGKPVDFSLREDCAGTLGAPPFRVTLNSEPIIGSGTRGLPMQSRGCQRVSRMDE